MASDMPGQYNAEASTWPCSDRHSLCLSLTHYAQEQQHGSCGGVHAVAPSQLLPTLHHAALASCLLCSHISVFLTHSSTVLSQKPSHTHHSAHTSILPSITPSSIPEPLSAASPSFLIHAWRCCCQCKPTSHTSSPPFTLQWPACTPSPLASPALLLFECKCTR